MIIKEEVSTLLEKQMDRRDFLKHLGLGFIALTGVATVLKVLAGSDTHSGVQAGYGNSAYGGKK